MGVMGSALKSVEGMLLLVMAKVMRLRALLKVARSYGLKENPLYTQEGKGR
jgi:hypothetical protein